MAVYDSWASGNTYTAADEDLVAQAINGSGWLVPCHYATSGAESYTISGGSVTQISGTALDGGSPSVGDRILVKDAPSASGAGSAFSAQPGNGVYEVTANSSNLSVSRVYEMSTSPSSPYFQGGAVCAVMAGTANGGLLFIVATPNNPDGGFAYGTNNIQWSPVGYLAGTGLVVNGATIELSSGAQADLVLAASSLQSTGNVLTTSGSAVQVASMSTGQIIFGDAGTPTIGSISGDISLGPSGAVDIVGGAVTLSKMAHLAGDSVVGNTGGSSATPTAVPLTSSGAASSIVSTDSDGNITANAFIEGATTTATAGGTTTLAVTSTQVQQFTGTATQTVILPNATTCSIGLQFYVTNRSSAAVTVEANGGSTLQAMAGGSQCVLTLISNGSTAGTWDVAYTIAGIIGTVSTVSVASTNGFAGSVATATSTPAITIETTVNGLLKGNGTGVSAAASGTDYAPATSGSSILKGNGSGGFSSATSGTDYAPATSGTSALAGNGSGAFQSATLTMVGTPTSSYSMGGYSLTSLGAPSSSTDAATKGYVDTSVQGLSAKYSAVAATNAETLTITSGSVTQITGTTVDGVAPNVNDYILIMNAPASTGAAGGATLSTQPANGLYQCTGNTTNLTVSRAADMSGSINPSGAYIFVESGSLWAAGGFVVTSSTSVSYDAEAGPYNALYTSQPLTWSHTCGTSADYLTVGVSGYDSSGGIGYGSYTWTVTYNGVAMTRLGAVNNNNTTGTGFTMLYGLANPTTGSSQTVSVGWTGGSGTSGVVGTSVSYDWVASVGTAVTDYGSSTAITSSAVSSTPHGMVVAAQSAYDQNITAASGTARNSSSVISSLYATLLMQDVVSIGSNTLTATTTSTTWGSVAASLIPSGFVYGTNNIVFTQFTGAGEIIAGTGISKSGTTLSVSLTGGTGISVSGATISVASSSIGPTQLSASGTASSGTYLRGDNSWQNFAGAVGSALTAGTAISISGETVSVTGSSIGLTQLSATGTASSSTYLRGDNSWANLNTAVQANALSSMTVPATAVSWNSYGITSLANPTTAQGAATKIYVDSTGFHLLCNWATTGTETFTISAGSVTQITGTSLDGGSPSVGDRILIKDAPASTGAGSVLSSQPANGIYVVSNATTNLSVSRASDMSSGGVYSSPAGSAVIVSGGTANAYTPWIVESPTNPDTSFTYSTTAIQWGSLINVANVLTRSGNTIEVSSMSTGQTIIGNAGTPTITTLSGDVTVGATGTTTIGSGVVSLSKQANLAANSVIGNTSGSSTTPSAVSLLTTATAGAVALRDTNANLTANSFIRGVATTATAVGTTTLTVTSAPFQQFTGTTTQIVVLPNATTLANGQAYTVSNQSTGSVTVETYGGTSLQVMKGGTEAVFTLISNSGSAGTWDANYSGGFQAASGKSLTVNNTLTLQGTDSTTFTFPTSNDTVAGIAATQTLTNKTISGSSNTLTNIPTSALPYSGAATASVATLETTTSSTYTQLTTTSDHVTVTVGASGMALVVISCQMYSSNAEDTVSMGFSVSGANTIAAPAGQFLSVYGNQNSTFFTVLSNSAVSLLTGLTSGSTTFTAKYSVASGATGTFADRNIIVIPL